MRYFVFFVFLFSAYAVLAQELESDRGPASTMVAPTTANPKRTYPGGADEEDLSVRATLPEAALRTDARSIQKEVYKTIYNQELKDESHETMEE